MWHQTLSTKSHFILTKNFCEKILTSQNLNRNSRSYGKLSYVIKGKEAESFPAYQYSTGIADKYQVHCWGLAEHGALGLGRPKNKLPFRYIPRPVLHHFSEENEIIDIKCGYGFTLFAVKSPHLLKVYGCGINTDYQIGYHDPRNNHPLGLIVAPAPIDLGLQCCDTNVISLSAGRAHSVIVTDKEGVFTLGSNCYGQCGRPVVEEEKFKGSRFIHSIHKLQCENIVATHCGQDHTFFITEKGKVFSCGWGADGQLGQGDFCSVSNPSRVCGDIKEEVIIKLTGKSDCTLALNNKGEVFGWGNNEYSQLDPERDGQLLHTPQKLCFLLPLGKIIDIAAGGTSCMALNENGEVFVWGYGILGAGPEIQKAKSPIQLPKTLFGCNEFQPGARVISISCGLSHYAAVNNFFDLFTWGKNRSGCIGVGHVRDQYFPFKVSLSSQVMKVSCGMDHTMALCKPIC